ncbi:hypothetical protein [Chitinasiproducens palmae]|uniref:Uncharacterized protein n=1 Tax=Chitinasiproducens palmae TaxID=1770053 RepID=A0A1H2PSC7_9BURK|nr:hypothetical protein [Chitinasiproducens palmae]SDV49858.1 hypothetical protein SAMN05216551_109198 [Chitinasiproducens palmae]
MRSRFQYAALAASLAGLAGPVAARAIDADLSCALSGHNFIEPLVASGAIAATPYRVEDNSVNVFQPTVTGNLTAYGKNVLAVLGFERDDPRFKTGKGEPIADWAYGVVVIGGADAVQGAAQRAASPAYVHRVAPLITAILCKKGDAAPSAPASAPSH